MRTDRERRRGLPRFLRPADRRWCPGLPWLAAATLAHRRCPVAACRWQHPCTRTERVRRLRMAVRAASPTLVDFDTKAVPRLRPSDLLRHESTEYPLSGVRRPSLPPRGCHHRTARLAPIAAVPRCQLPAFMQTLRNLVRAETCKCILLLRNMPAAGVEIAAQWPDEHIRG